MRAQLLLPVLVAIQLPACATTPAPLEEQRLWARFDCQRISQNPGLQAALEQSRAICVPRAEAAAISGTAAMPVGYGLGGAIASGISQGVTGNQISRATMSSCMAEQGWTLRTLTEHEAVCPVPPPPPMASRPSTTAKR